MGFLKSTKGSIISDYFLTMEKTMNIGEKEIVDIALYEDHLEIKNKKQTLKLDYDQVTDVFHGYEDVLVEKQRSPIGRAVVGGLLFGGAGAVVGAISGTQTTKKKKKLLFIVCYTGSDGGEKFLKFEDTRMYKGKKIAKQLKEFSGIEDSVPPEEVHL